jgi:hypothetical protein
MILMPTCLAHGLPGMLVKAAQRKLLSKAAGWRCVYQGQRRHWLAQMRHGRAGMALRMGLARAFFAAAALRGNAQFELDVVKTPARLGAARDLSIADSVADTNNHAASINENCSYLQVESEKALANLRQTGCFLRKIGL